MLLLAREFRQLPMADLMEVYIEGNRENGADLYPLEEPARALELAQQDFEDYLRRDFFKIPGALYALWEEEGVKAALRLEPYEDGYLVCALETRPDCRRQGCGRKLLQQVQALAFVRRLYSHVHRQNLPSLALHRQCGFVQGKDYARYLDGSINRRCVTLVWEKQ